jgi:dihydrofolate reductase
VGSLADAWAVAEKAAAAGGGDEVFVGGGVSVYLEALPAVDRVYLTRVHAVVAGDRSMPAGWLDGFRLVRREAVDDPDATFPYEWLDYERVGQ